MTRRKKLTILAVILILAIILLLWFLLRFRQAQGDVVVVPVQEIEELPAPTTSPIQQQRVEERQTTASVQTLAKTFTERYGSYSNESEFENLRDLFPLMTQEFAGKTALFIQNTTIPETFYGVTTRVISIDVVEYDEVAGSAQLTVKTQREEAIDSSQNISVRYQDLEIDFVFQGGQWFISDAVWQ